VAHDNTVESDMVANAEIGIKGKGSLTRVQRPGLLTQLFQAIF
jgi:flagellar L-ring protein precursor FlgH